jgi:hypothetical protein
VTDETDDDDPDQRLLAAVTSHYLGGRDFNGFPLRNLGLRRDELLALLTPLVEAELISLNFGVYHPNPHIKAFPPEPVANQLQRLAEDDLHHATTYPESAHLEGVVDRDAYAGRPFTLRLALGAPELLPACFFELSVLESYRNDPRYVYDTEDTSGRIVVSDDYYESEAMREADQILLESFGFAYDEDLSRVVCVCPVYLARLTPEHQQLWAARELEGEFRVHPAYFDSSIRGEFPEKVSIFDAFLEELSQLRAMSERIGLPPVVRRDFADARPHGFGFLIRPTLKELQDFHILLDKMMSDNLNADFFKAAGLAMESEHPRHDGRIEVRRRGTVALLEEWSGPGRIRFHDREPRDEMLAAFREVRRLRQRPAHAADDNRFDQEFFTEQRQLMIRAYDAVRTLRQILAMHPGLKDYDEVPDWLYKGEIYTY